MFQSDDPRGIKQNEKLIFSVRRLTKSGTQGQVRHIAIGAAQGQAGVRSSVPTCA